MRAWTGLLFAACCGMSAATAVADESNTTSDRASAGVSCEIVDQLVRVIQTAIDQRTVVGAQIAIGTSDELVLSRSFGVIAPCNRCCVNRQTLFCIGSCSKPIVSACLMTLVDEGTLTLDQPISDWLDEFLHLQDEHGQPVERAPTVREVLAHRGGIYSQRRELTPAQIKAIRDFRLTLAESVEIISQQPLIATPGESFHYSGAGYCVLGQVAEASADRSIEELLKSRLGEPLSLTRSTFFPAAGDRNIAAGGLKVGRRIQTHPESPHLLREDLRLPLVGGSIYSTAEETARFAGMMLNAGRICGQQILSEQSYAELTRRQYDDGNYGLGWALRESDDGQTVALNHGGALYSYRSLLSVNLANDYYVVVHWTLSDPDAMDIRGALREVLRQAE